MFSNEYQQFLEKFETKKYVSVYAEYKRVISKQYSGTIFSNVENVFQGVLKAIFKNQKNFDLFEGQKILTRDHKNAFVKEFENNKILSIIFKHQDSFHVHKYKFKQLYNGYTKFYFIHSIKNPFTIVGLNGKLGSWKFKRDHNQQAKAMIEYLNKILKTT